LHVVDVVNAEPFELKFDNLKKMTMKAFNQGIQFKIIVLFHSSTDSAVPDLTIIGGQASSGIISCSGVDPGKNTGKILEKSKKWLIRLFEPGCTSVVHCAERSAQSMRRRSRWTPIVGQPEAVSGGRPLAEILDEVKLFSNLGETSKIDAAVDAIVAISGAPADASPCGSSTRSDERTADVAEPLSVVGDPPQSSIRWRPTDLIGGLRSLRAKMIALTVAFTLVAIFIYVEFGRPTRTGKICYRKRA
jgi:hypothetical protein